MGRKKDKPRDRSYLEVRFQNLNNKKKLCPFAFQVAFFVFLFDCLISTCFLEKNTLGTRDYSSAVSGFCQVFIGFFLATTAFGHLSIPQQQRKNL